jgi:hypothetical protein
MADTESEVFMIKSSDICECGHYYGNHLMLFKDHACAMLMCNCKGFKKRHGDLSPLQKARIDKALRARKTNVNESRVRVGSQQQTITERIKQIWKSMLHSSTMI